VSVTKSVDQVRFITRVADARTEREEREREKGRRVAESGAHYGADNLPALIADLEAQMREAATNLDFETAAQLHDDIHEETTFGRGKGVVMEFVEYGPVKYGFQRLGRIGDSSMNVVGKVTRTAKGGADIVQNTSVPFPCPVLQHHDLSQNPDCGKTKTDNAPWGLKIDGNHFRPVPKGGLGGNFVSQNECGRPPSGSAFQGGGENELEYGWPLPAQFIWQPIPYAKMFNQRSRAFKVDFETLPRPNSKKTSHSGIAGSLETTVSDWGEAHATVRFIRCFPKSVAKAGQPAC